MPMQDPNHEPPNYADYDVLMAAYRKTFAGFTPPGAKRGVKAGAIPGHNMVTDEVVGRWTLADGAAVELAWGTPMTPLSHHYPIGVSVFVNGACVSERGLFCRTWEQALEHLAAGCPAESEAPMAR